MKERIDMLRFIEKEHGYAKYPGSEELRRVLPYTEAMQCIEELFEALGESEKVRIAAQKRIDILCTLCDRQEQMLSDLGWEL